MKRFIMALLLLALLLPQGMALALDMDPIYADGENDGDTVYRLFDEQGKFLTSRASKVFVDDELITGDDELYRVVSVDEAQCTAALSHLGKEPAISRNEATAVAAVLSQTASPEATEKSGQNTNNLICMYSTHSDESYVPDDGTSSKLKDAGIYDVGDSLKKQLEALGVNVEYSKKTSLPHDAGAYRRSRQIAEDFIKQRPAALLDIHRDGIPDASEYTTKVDGEDMTKVRLFVGRNNPNSDANRAFAKKVKAEADKKYPGFIKDIFIGKGNYNQELYPKALLLEMGTHTSDKDEVEKSTKYIAEVLNDVLFGGTAKAEETPTENSAGATGIAWLIGLAILGAVAYALVSTGTLSNWKQKLARGTSEITGGVIGEKPDKHKK